MALASLNRTAFEEALKQNLSPTTPIRSAEHLHGRARKLEDIRRALLQPGRQVFIYGDRGVGKTSLAQTAAFEHQSASKNPILLGCDPSSSFYQVAEDLASRLLNLDPTVIKQTSQRKGALGWMPFASAEMQKAIEKGHIPKLKSMNEAVAAVSHIASAYSTKPVVVIDEFERIQDASERALFADFIKQLGDQSIDVKLIFCGVGAALSELLDTHHSCYRYLSAIELERLPLQPRLDIISGASRAIGLTIEDTTRYRIALISDGFPHYIHLITEKLLWEVYGDRKDVAITAPQHYIDAVRAAVVDIEPRLRTIYEKSVLKYGDDYEPVLWAVADHHELKRRSADIYESYRRIMLSRSAEPLSREKFNTRMNLLKRSTHGAILKATRQGWYEFSEAVVRGYVRLRAEARGVELGIEHPLEARRPSRPLTEIS